MRVLYITHYGIMEPLGQSQILPYLEGLAARGYAIDILSFEKQALLAERDRVRTQKESLDRSGIRWSFRPYRRGASLRSLLPDLVRTAAEVSARCRQNRIDLIHCRSHIPLLTAWYASVAHDRPLLFDFRGFVAEEYVDAGLWSNRGVRFRLTKILERRMAASCAAMVVLTRPARDYLTRVYRLPAEKLFVVPCCVDLSRFGTTEDTSPRPPGRPLKVVYSGSTDGRYDLQGMLSFFSLLLEKRPGSHFSILSTGDLDKVRASVEHSSVPGQTVSVLSLPHDRVSQFLSTQDLGLFFLRGSLTLIAASPTKIGEYLSCGLAVVAEKGIGGLEEVLSSEAVGCLAGSNEPAGWEAVADQAIRLCDRPETRLKAARAAAEYYSLSQGIETYSQAYDYAVRSTR